MKMNPSITSAHFGGLGECAKMLMLGRGQTDRGYKKPVTNTDNEIAIPLGIKRIPDN